MTVNKKQKCEGSGTGGGLLEETAHANATFEFYVRKDKLAYHPIYGSILVGGEKVGSIEGTLVNRRHVRMNGRRCKISFRTVCAKASAYLVKSAALLFDVNGFCDCERMLESEAWSSDADKGGLVHIDMVRVAKEHRGRELSLQALRYLLTVELKGEWTLAAIRPFLAYYETKPEDDKICEEFSRMQKRWTPVSEEMKRQKAEVAERHDRAHLALSRYYARMGFTQANSSFWFLAAGKPMLRSRAECDALPVMTKPSDILSEAEEKLVEMARAAAPIQAADVEALVARGASLKRAAPLHHCVTAGHLGHIPAFLAAGCTINDQDLYGSTPLHAAAEGCGEDKMVKATEALKGYGADPGMVNNDGRTPLEVLELMEDAWYFRCSSGCNIDCTCGCSARSTLKFKNKVRRFRAMMMAW